MTKLCIISTLIATMFCQLAIAASVTVTVTSNQGNPVNQAVVYLTPLGSLPESQDRPLANMDQVNAQFVPHILVVQKGDDVAFPNSDSIKHHVYSFSPAKTFELPLYKGQAADPLNFGKSGLVELGCNVHDWMLGYILVVDTPYYQKAQTDGKAVIDVPPGSYQLTVWHPRIQDDEATLTQTIEVSESIEMNLALSKDLLEDLSGYESEQESFSDYE